MSGGVHHEWVATRGPILVLSHGIRQIPDLDAFLGCSTVPTPRRPFGAVVGWGAKPNTRRARAIARERSVPYLALEDGFLRSLMPGVTGAAPHSIVVDDLGIYYDATQPSRLEHWLADASFSADELARADALLARLRDTGLSKYNHQPALDLGPKERPRVLVVDQTAGDQSIRLGLPSCDFAEMVERTLEAHPDDPAG